MELLQKLGRPKMKMVVYYKNQLKIKNQIKMKILQMNMVVICLKVVGEDEVQNFGLQEQEMVWR